MAGLTVTIPYVRRPLQRVLHKLLDAHRFVVAVCHRRFGKTVAGVNHLQKLALTCKLSRPRTGYLAPTYRQGKAVAWDFMQEYARGIPDLGVNHTELRIDYPNKGQCRIYGADDPDSLRGLYFDGVCFDEYGMHARNIFSEVIAPLLVDRGGRALFLGTPNGKNQFHEIKQHAIARKAAGDPEWAFIEFKASESGILDPAYLAAARATMTEDEYAQEFECSFEASVKGAIYAKELSALKAAGRVCPVPIDAHLPVHTIWDLGFGAQGDSTAIWFYQALASGAVHVIDYHEAAGEGLPYYAKVLRDKGYRYGQHVAPHDILVQESTGKSRLEVAAEQGIWFLRCPNISVEDGIHAARLLFARCRFDAIRCAPGLESLQHYRRDYNDRLNEFKATPVHNWASHGADAWRYLAVWETTPKDQRPVRQRAAVNVGATTQPPDLSGPWHAPFVEVPPKTPAVKRVVHALK